MEEYLGLGEPRDKNSIGPSNFGLEKVPFASLEEYVMVVIL